MPCKFANKRSLAWVKEAIINAMVAAETMEGINGNKAYALPQKKVMELLRKYGRVK